MSEKKPGIDSTGTWTSAQYVVDMGWDFTCIDATARLGVSETDAEGLTEDQQADLLDFCRERAATFRCPECGGSTFGRDTGGDPPSALTTVRCHDEHMTGCRWRGEWPPRDPAAEIAALRAQRAGLLRALEELAMRTECLMHYADTGATVTHWTDKQDIAEPGSVANHGALKDAYDKAKLAIRRARGEGRGE